MRKMQMLILIATVALGSMVPVQGETYFVGNGDEAQLAAVLEKVQPGDTIRLGPGRYRSGIIVPCDNLTIEAAGPKVILDGSVEVKAVDFRPVEGRPGVYAWPLPKEMSRWYRTKAPWIWFGNIMLFAADDELDAVKDLMSFYINSKTRQLEVNITGKDMPKDAVFTVPVVTYLIDAENRNGLTVRGLELTRSAAHAIRNAGGRDMRVEYCHVYWCGDGIYAGDNAVVARCTTAFNNANGIQHGGDNGLVEQNLVVSTRIAWDGLQRWAGTIKHNATSRTTFRQNWIVDSSKPGWVKAGPVKKLRIWKFSSGLWPDINCYNNNYYNNAIARMGHAGIYIEHTARGNVVMYNAVQDCSMGITIRQGGHNLVTRNWIFDREYLGWGKVDTTGYCAYGPGFDKETGKEITTPEQHPMWGKQYLEGLCLWHAYDGMVDASMDNAIFGNLVQVSGHAVSVPFATFTWETQPAGKPDERGLIPVDKKKKWVAAPLPGLDGHEAVPPSRPFTNELQRNYYDRPADDRDFAWLGDKVAPTFSDYRAQTGWDSMGKVGRFTVDETLGVEPIWTIPWAALDKETPVAILHDPTFETASVLDFRQPMFWTASHMVPGYSSRLPATTWTPKRRQAPLGRGDAVNGTRCLYLMGTTTTKKRVKGKLVKVPWTETISWTSAAIPVKPGTTMGLDFWMKGVDLKPAQKGTGAKVTVRFTDACGFDRGEVVVVGIGAHENLMSGTYDYTNVVGKAKVPEGGCWMRVVIALEPSDGILTVDDFRIGMVDPVPPSLKKRK